MEDDGVLVGSGSFKLDKARALELLRDYQAPEPGMHLHAWMRCAAAAGATRVSLKVSRGELALQFDGRAFTKDELSDPYSPLFIEGRPDERRRELALGLLTALRAGGRVVIDSGSGSERTRLTVPELGREAASRTSGSTGGTLLTARWKPAGSGRGPSVSECRDLFALHPARITLNGTSLPESPAPAGSEAFKRGAARGWLRADTGVEGLGSRLWVYKHGVRVCSVEASLPVPVTGLVNDDRLSLDLSRTGLIRDRRWAKVDRLLGEAALRLLHRVMREQTARLPKLPGHLAHPECLEAWRDRSAYASSMRDPWSPEEVTRSLLKTHRLSPPKTRKLLLRMQWDGWRGDWLHRAARSLQSAKDPRAADALRALGRVPMFLRADAGVMTLDEADALAEREGSIPFSRKPRKSPGQDSPTIWCPSPDELSWLRARFGQSVREAG